MPKRRTIKQLPMMDRPREKMQHKGPRALSDFELLEVLIGSGNKQNNVGQIAQQIQKLLQKGATNLNYEALTSLGGVSIAHACRILAAIELAKRHLVQDAEPLQSLRDILSRFADLRTKQQEYLVCLSLDGGQRMISKRTVTIGTLDSVLAHPREVFSDPIVDRAASIIIAHNHPSGDCEPSGKDIELTQQLAACGQLLGIPVKDHLILTKTGYYSFRQNHRL